MTFPPAKEWKCVCRATRLHIRTPRFPDDGLSRFARRLVCIFQTARARQTRRRKKGTGCRSAARSLFYAYAHFLLRSGRQTACSKGCHPNRSANGQSSGETCFYPQPTYLAVPLHGFSLDDRAAKRRCRFRINRMLPLDLNWLKNGKGRLKAVFQTA